MCDQRAPMKPTHINIYVKTENYLSYHYFFVAKQPLKAALQEEIARRRNNMKILFLNDSLKKKDAEQ